MLPIETDGAEILVDPPLARRVAERHSGADGCHHDEPVGFAAGDQVGLVEAVCLIRRRRPDAGRAGWSAMAKGPVPRAQVGALGLVGDRQADRDHHGGPDKAGYAMDAAEVDHWLAVMPGLQVGGMGENLTIRSAAGSQTGIDDLELGARLWVGPAETFPGASRPWQGTCGLVLRVTGVRNPCPTFARGMGRGDWIQGFSARSRPRVRSPRDPKSGSGRPRAMASVAGVGSRIMIRETPKRCWPPNPPGGWSWLGSPAPTLWPQPNRTAAKKTGL